MACTSCASDKAGTLNDPKWRRALWIALAINGGMFVIEIVAGITGGSKALQADALDFFGDTANYAISLGVAGMAIAWRARAAMLKGATLALLGIYPVRGGMGGAPRRNAPCRDYGHGWHRGADREPCGRGHAVPLPKR